MSITRLDVSASAVASTLAYAVSAGSDRLLVVMVSAEWGGSSNENRVPDDVDYGGQPMVKARTELAGVPSGTQSNASIWYLLDAGIAAAVGTTITPTWSNPLDVNEEIIQAASYEGAKQDSGVVIEHKGDNVNAGTPNPFTTVDLIESDGNLIVAQGQVGDDVGQSASWQADMTEQEDNNGTTMAASFADRLSTTEANVTIELTWAAAPNRHSIVSVHFAAVAVTTGTKILANVESLASGSVSSSTYVDVPGLTTGAIVFGGNAKTLIFLANMVQLSVDSFDATAVFQFAVDGIREGPQVQCYKDAIDRADTLSGFMWTRPGLVGTHTVTLMWKAITGTPACDTTRERNLQVIEVDA